VIVDTKVVTSFNDSHLAQMLGYLNITGLKTALLLNFKYSRLQCTVRLIIYISKLRVNIGHASPRTPCYRD
jgi:GxxExxY protein